MHGVLLDIVGSVHDTNYMSTEQITYSQKPYGSETVVMDCWTMTVGGVEASELYADVETGEIMNVATAAEFRGCGYAAALYHAALTTHRILHAPESHRTAEGHAWATRVGGESVADCTTCCATCADCGQSDDLCCC